MKAPTPVSEFVRAAVQEKAERDLARLDQQICALEAVRDARASLEALLETLSRGTAPVVAVATASAAIGRFKKLRRSVEEAHTLAGELAIELDVHDGLGRLAEARTGILAELDAVAAAAAE
jgi:hypothetical protein